MSNIKNPERFEKVGKFSEGYAIAKLADGRGYVIINEDGEISKRINEKGEKVESIIKSNSIIDNTLENANFKNGILTFCEEHSFPNCMSRSTKVVKNTNYVTKSGYVFVGESDEVTYGEMPEGKTHKDYNYKFREVFNDPEKFLDLDPKEDIKKDLFILRGYLDVVQHSMECSFDRLRYQENIDKAIKFADKVDKKFKKWQKIFAKDNSKEKLGTKIRNLGE